MSAEDTTLVQATWRLVLPRKEEAAQLFYGKLFALEPGLRPLFKQDIDDQGRKLIAMVTAAINGLSRFEALEPVIRDLGRRHASYGMRDEHYGSVATAMLWMLELVLAHAFTPNVRTAWIRTYGVLSQIMLNAAASARAA
jgi:hemoglobin-like flavoprotein